MEMARIHPDDETCLQRILRTQNLPANVLSECERWTRAYHGAGQSGPLSAGPSGLVGLIALARFAGAELPEIENKPSATIWNTVRVNTRIEAHFGGVWIPGVFNGLAPNGALAVKLDHEAGVREVYPHVIRLPGVNPDAAVAGQSAEAAPKDAPNTQPAAASDQDSGKLPQPNMKEALKEQPAEQSAALPVATQEPPPTDPSLDWLKVMRGDRVWAQRNGDYEDATFEKIGLAGSKNGVETLLVVFEGVPEPVEVPASDVTLAT
jgi:hypothetical protein